MHYFIIAGEASGDLHASHLITALKERDPGAHFTFLGGDMMAATAGHGPVIHYNRMAFMGFSEVLRNLRTVMANLRTARTALQQAGPDALILVDYPSFNLKVAKTARQLGIPTYYYISPKVWAWKEHRVKAIRRLTRRVYSILPFEVAFYGDRHNMQVTYVGNPSVHEVDAHMATAPARNVFLERNRLRDRPLVALLPGSRVGEIRNNLRVMSAVIERFPQYRGVIAGAPGIDAELYRRFSDLPVVHGQTLDLLAHSRAALVTSGTATLEAALAGVPQVACYRSNGSRLAYKIMSRLLKVKYVTLPNLIADAPVIPEQLLHLCTPDLVADQLAPLLRDTPQRQAQLDGYALMRRHLDAPGTAPDNAAADIIATLTT